MRATLKLVPRDTTDWQDRHAARVEAVPPALRRHVAGWRRVPNISAPTLRQRDTGGASVCAALAVTDWFDSAAPGDWLLYAQGPYLPVHVICPALLLLDDLFSQGLIELVQARPGGLCVSLLYLAQRRRRPCGRRRVSL